MHPVEEELAEGLPDFKALSEHILFVAELHVFLSSKVVAPIAAISEGVVEVVTE